MEDNELFKKYFEVKDNSLVVTGDKYAEIYLDKSFFDSNISSIVGECVETFGFLDIYCWDEYSEERSIKDATQISLKIPTVIISKPGRIEEDKGTETTILEFFGGDKIINSLKVAKSWVPVYNYLNILFNGKTPSSIGYDKLCEYFEMCCDINNIGTKSNILFIDAMVATISRDPDNLARPFRMKLVDNPKTSMLDRKLVNIMNLPAMTSMFGAISSGNPKFGITTTIGAVNTGDMVIDEKDESLIEKAIK